MKENLSTTKSSETNKNSIGYKVFHWAILIYLFAVAIGLCYCGFLFLDYLVTTIKSWM